MNGQHHGGKGSAQRPGNQATFDANYDAIFGKKPAEPVPELKYYCQDCNKCYDKTEILVVELRDSYDIGDRTVWETCYEDYCGICGADGLVETYEEAEAYNA